MNSTVANPSGGTGALRLDMELEYKSFEFGIQPLKSGFMRWA